MGTVFLGRAPIFLSFVHGLGDCLSKMGELANTVGMSPIKFQVQALRIWA